MPSRIPTTMVATPIIKTSNYKHMDADGATAGGYEANVATASGCRCAAVR
jgi:hypothetical protein